MPLIYKISDQDHWDSIRNESNYNGSKIDENDGFIHFSTQEQLQETLEKHYKGQKNLLLIAVNSEDLGPELKWEPARDGALFPHLYGPLQKAHIVWEKPIIDTPQGTHCLPNGI